MRQIDDWEIQGLLDQEVEFMKALSHRNIIKMLYHKVHRDLKPAILLVSGEDKDANIRICDFGLSVSKADEISGKMGSLPYIGPEVYFAEIL